MYQKFNNIHFIGIGGIGMSGIAELLINLGYHITGSDINKSQTTKRLESMGAVIFYEHNPENIKDVQVVVLSSAVNEDNPEVAAAIDTRECIVISRAEMLAELMRLKYGIAVAGSHGKTTTTSMLAGVLTSGGLDPTVVIGGRLNSWGTNAKLGKGDFLLAEADESDGSFMSLSPSIAVVTNIDNEHLDFYENLDAIKEIFINFINKVPFYGSAILCLDDPNIQSIIPYIKKRYTTYGVSTQADIKAYNISTQNMSSKFNVIFREHELGNIYLPIPGDHMVLNSLAAIAAGMELDIPFEKIKDGLERLGGVSRRFEIKGEVNGITILDDYGHHPTEIIATLKTLCASWTGKRRIVVFQPHRYTRTKALLDEFTKAFYQSDELIIMDIYSANEKPIEGINSSMLADMIQKHGHKDVKYIGTHKDIVEYLIKRLNSKDVLLTLGAGNVFKVGEDILSALGKDM